MLRDSQILYVKSQAKKQEKKQRKREKRERSLGWFRGGSAASVSSETDSQVSAQTAVDEDILPVDSTADKPGKLIQTWNEGTSTEYVSRTAGGRESGRGAGQ